MRIVRLVLAALFIELALLFLWHIVTAQLALSLQNLMLPAITFFLLDAAIGILLLSSLRSKLGRSSEKQLLVLLLAIFYITSAWALIGDFTLSFAVLLCIDVVGFLVVLLYRFRSSTIKTFAFGIAFLIMAIQVCIVSAQAEMTVALYSRITILIHYIIPLTSQILPMGTAGPYLVVVSTLEFLPSIILIFSAIIDGVRRRSSTPEMGTSGDMTARFSLTEIVIAVIIALGFIGGNIFLYFNATASHSVPCVAPATPAPFPSPPPCPPTAIPL